MPVSLFGHSIELEMKRVWPWHVLWWVCFVFILIFLVVLVLCGWLMYDCSWFLEEELHKTHRDFQRKLTQWYSEACVKQDLHTFYHWAEKCNFEKYTQEVEGYRNDGVQRTAFRNALIRIQDQTLWKFLLEKGSIGRRYIYNGMDFLLFNQNTVFACSWMMIVLSMSIFLYYIPYWINKDYIKERERINLAIKQRQQSSSSSSSSSPPEVQATAIVQSEKEGEGIEMDEEEAGNGFPTNAYRRHNTRRA